jgi:hypothetical protein
MKKLSHIGKAWRYVAAAGGITNTTAVTIADAPGAGKAVHLTEIEIINANATGTEVAIRNGAGGAVLWRGFAVQALGPVIVKFEEPIICSVNTLMEVVCLTTASITYVNARGVIV